MGLHTVPSGGFFQGAGVRVGGSESWGFALRHTHVHTHIHIVEPGQTSLIFCIFTYFTSCPLNTGDTWKPLSKLTFCPVPVLPSTSSLPTLTVHPRVKGTLGRDRLGVFSGWCWKESAHYPLNAAPGRFQASGVSPAPSEVVQHPLAFLHTEPGASWRERLARSTPEPAGTGQPGYFLLETEVFLLPCDTSFHPGANLGALQDGGSGENGVTRLTREDLDGISGGGRGWGEFAPPSPRVNLPVVFWGN